MSLCDSAVGYFMGYHPLFPEGANYNIIEFRKMDLWDDFKLLKIRENLAFETINKIKQDMMAK